ncbi:shematrin-like protein 1 [Prunus yedoensis var. nudiflora]|uniref:Shematrin-like protein 1 n=1 Tax=Prunus yedoensis var. nudiflora TaxID=2094558 RepID=A0A314ZFI8_PRUYE|nr:shematrin-like protein 1 [Prunus yedoensis var. nudiflora]
MNQNGSNDQNGFGGQTNQGGYNGQHDSTYQYSSGSQFNGQHGGNNNHGQNNMIYQNYANGQHGYNVQNNQVAGGQYTYPDGQNNPTNIYDQPSYGSHQMNHPNGYNGQNVLSIGERPYVDRTDKEHQNFTKEIEVKDLFMEMAVSNELLIQQLREISLRLAIEEQVLSQQAKGQTLNPNLDSQSQVENSHVVASWPPIPPTPLKESEVSREYESEKEMGETTVGSNVQVDSPIESLTLVEEKESTQGNETQKMVTDENCNMAQPKATILGCNGLQSSEKEGRSMTQDAIMIDMIVGEKLDIVRPQLQVVKFIEPQPKAKIGRPSGFGGHEGSAKVMARSHPGGTSRHSISTHRQQNGKIQVKNKKGSKLGVKHGSTAMVSMKILFNTATY